MLIEAAAGLLDRASPEERIKAEVEEETGYRVDHVRKIFEAFMSPGSVTEKLYFFVAEYDSSSRTALGGGNQSEGEDIEVLELSVDDAIAAIESGEIADGKTIMLLQHAYIHLFEAKGKVV
jgi:nudix-type nucleoside diphosphatase (YffH/AdpP family)